MSKLSQLELGFMPTPLESGDESFQIYSEQSFDFDMDDTLSLEQKDVMSEPQQSGSVSATINCDPCHIPLCVGCGSPIHDQYILRVAPNLEWHAGCLKCCDCGQYLDETCTCFVRDGKTYCKKDYTRLFGAKCNKCGQGFSKSDYVMRAKDKIFHVDCFKCVACSRQLIPGDECALREDDLFCKADHDVVTAGEMIGHHEPHHMPGYPSPANGLNGVMSPGAMGRMHNPVPNGNDQSKGSHRSSQKRKDGKTTRVRTVLNEKQLLTLRTCYAANCRPDALMKEQLTEMTGLSPRVIRVWFQNKRCKDKKRSIAMKQMQEQQAKQQQQQQSGEQGAGGNTNSGLSAMNGVAMVASEPVRNDSAVSVNAVEVHNYQQPAWKALSDFALQSEIEQPAFQQLVNNFSDHNQSSMSDSEISSIPSVSSSSHEANTACTTPLTAESNMTACS